MSEKIEKPKGFDFKIDLPSVGLGTYRTTTTYICLLASLEDNPIGIMDSVLDHLNIHPELILHYRKRPDCLHEEERAVWQKEHEELEARLNKNNNTKGREG